MQHVSNFVSIYLRRNIITILLLGFVSGLPLALTASTLSVWLTEEGVSKVAIGLFAAVATPYALKFLWAPLIDHVPLPLLYKLLGRRRSWIVLTQCALILALIGLGYTNPTINPFYTALWALLVAICSATQDIAIDAYRVESLEEEQQGAGAAVIVFGYRIGMLISGAGALFLAEFLSWQEVYSIMALCMGVGIATILFAPEPFASKPVVESENFSQWLYNSVVSPFAEFTQRQYWLLILLFVIAYKLGDAFAGVMTNPFLIDIGFSKLEIASIVKTYGLFATLIGAFIGGSIVGRFGIVGGLWICGILQMLSNLVFAIQAYIGHDLWMLSLTIGIENLSGGMGSAAFVAFLSKLCNREHTATQYALLSALAAFGRTWLSTPSGYVAEYTGWIEFFIFTTMLALPGLLFLMVLRNGRFKEVVS